MNLEQQQQAVISYLPNAMTMVKNLVDGSYGCELGTVISARVASGSKVFGHRIFTMQAGELRFEGVEELADAIIYLCTYIYVCDHGTLEEEVKG